MTEYSIDAVVTDCPKDLFIDGKWQGSKDGRSFQVLGLFAVEGVAGVRVAVAG